VEDLMAFTKADIVGAPPEEPEKPAGEPEQPGEEPK
jgi:hypothetical protein